MASFQTFRLVPMREEVLGEKDEWAGLSDAKERRKRQNRINKRAARRRQRLTEAREHEARFEPENDNASHKVVAGTATAPVSSAVYFPLTRDSQLLHVIAFNVSRAILTNYFILSVIPLETTRFCSVCRVFTLPSPGAEVEVTLPVSLMPTPLQERIPHPGWVDLFPSPRLRDNLILALQEYDIDEDAFMIDLVGEAFDSLCLTSDEDEDQPAVAGSEDSDPKRQPAPVVGESDSLITANLANSWIGESGIISWSDPWDTDGWEVTESFAKKWGFLLIGCDDVVNAANKWRESRGENPLSVKI
ncbi:hypothetical protein CEP54_002741 [Fusarium duplospermum]|uniref:BZIP domain-containing protein n=1 Tax=Fusarium duplospermum TaxID=1325734 RepID=A0A428QTP6_9HYPO|nr:hypothetical protein CEP54_002741 [Fusarium duplospermum]